MKFENVLAKLVVTSEQPVTMDFTLEDGEVKSFEVTPEEIRLAFASKGWRSGIVVKTKREAPTGSKNAIIKQALSLELIEKDDAFNYMMDGITKEKLAEIKELLPETEKSKAPTELDVDTGMMQAFAGGGQR